MTETNLLPCPFCGGGAETHETTFPHHYWYVLCDGECFDHFCERPTEAEAIEAWNTRAERTCHVEDTTCTCNDDVWTTAKCSKCGADYTIDFEYLNYCPSCGAKVVKQ